MSDTYAQCPSCGEYMLDLDGFGVLTHAACGYCCHPSIDGDTCCNCGQVVERRS